MKKILMLLGFKVKANINLVALIKQSMVNYYNDNNYTDCISRINSIVVSETKKEIIIEITAYRVGLLIGKGGRIIDGLKNWIETTNEIKKPIKIRMFECKLWEGVYFSNKYWDNIY